MIYYNLAEAALKVSTDEYPELDVTQYINRLDAYADVIRTRLHTAAGVSEIVEEINQYLFDELGFTGNIDDYYDPRNSYLNDVMDRRLGIPITLSLIFIEISRRLGLRTQGVSFPGHFLVKCDMDDADFLILDPFAGGKILNRDELESRMHSLYGEHPGIADTLEELLRGASQTEFLNRILNNLKAIYLSAGNFEKALYVIDRIVKLRPDLMEERRDRGKVYMALECFTPAINDLEAYTRRVPDADDSNEVRDYLIDLYQRVGHIH